MWIRTDLQINMKSFRQKVSNPATYIHWSSHNINEEPVVISKKWPTLLWFSIQIKFSSNIIINKKIRVWLFMMCLYGALSCGSGTVVMRLIASQLRMHFLMHQGTIYIMVNAAHNLNAVRPGLQVWINSMTASTNCW